MRESDKNRILNFLIGNEAIQDFESWVYSESELESRIGAEFYFELIEINYHDKNILENLKKVVLDNFISRNEFEISELGKVLQYAGWYPGRCIVLNLSTLPATPEIKNAIRIIEEYGGLEFITDERSKIEKLTLIKFLEAPGQIQNMNEYGLDQNLVCFASAHNDHIDLFVDENNKFYQLDNIVGEDLYEYKGVDFEHMMRQLLKLDERDNFQIVGSNTSRKFTLTKKMKQSVEDRKKSKGIRRLVFSLISCVILFLLFYFVFEMMLPVALTGAISIFLMEIWLLPREDKIIDTLLGYFIKSKKEE